MLDPNPYKRPAAEHPGFKAQRHADIYKFMSVKKSLRAELAAIRFRTSKTSIYRSMKTVNDNIDWFKDNGLI